MNPELLEILRCPATGSQLRLQDTMYLDGRVHTATLIAEDGAHSYPVRDFIPRFVAASNYADNFGMQWNKFRRTQLDSYSGQTISADRFWKATGWTSAEMKGKWVLDAGCGAGRFAEVALQTGAQVIALDFSRAVDACLLNLGHYPNLHVVQGDIYALPLPRDFFPWVYSLGVLQHTPNVAKAFAALPPMLAPGGRLCADFYWKRVRTLLHAKYFFRPITKRMPQEKLFELLRRRVPSLLAASQTLGRIPVLGKFAKRIVPVADYTGIFPLDDVQLQEWALLDTFDMLAPEYDNPQTAATVRRWIEAAGLVDAQVFHGGHLVGRSRKP